MRKRPAALALMLLGALPCAVAASSPAEVSPWELVEQAELIVIARVVEVELDLTIDPSISPPYSDEQVAILEILDVWKGDPGPRIPVHFELSAPERYVPGGLVLAFLERGESRVRRWRETVESQAEIDAAWEARLQKDFPELLRALRKPGPSEQTKEAILRFETWAAGRWLQVLAAGIFEDDTEDVEAFRDLVQEAVRLQAAGRDEEGDQRDWYVSLAENRSMREVAVNKLSAGELSSGQLARLASSFVREPAFDHIDAYLLELLSGYADPDVDRTAVAVVEAGLLEKPTPFWLIQMVDETLRRYGRETDWMAGDSASDLATIWEAARRGLGIPVVSPLEVPERRVAGVGGETPD